MSTDVQRPVPATKATQFLDENGVPKIASSVPLILMGAGLLFGTPLMAFTLYQMFRMAATGEANDGDEVWELAGDYRRMLWVVGAVRTLWLGWLCAAAYQFFRRRSAARPMLMTMIASGILLSFLEAGWEISLGGPTEQAVALIFGTIVPFIWLIYFWRSKVVRKVFVYPVASDGLVTGEEQVA